MLFLIINNAKSELAREGSTLRMLQIVRVGWLTVDMLVESSVLMSILIVHTFLMNLIIKLER